MSTARLTCTSSKLAACVAFSRAFGILTATLGMTAYVTSQIGHLKQSVSSIQLDVAHLDRRVNLVDIGIAGTVMEFAGVKRSLSYIFFFFFFFFCVCCIPKCSLHPIRSGSSGIVEVFMRAPTNALTSVGTIEARARLTDASHAKNTAQVAHHPCWAPIYRSRHLFTITHSETTSSLRDGCWIQARSNGTLHSRTMRPADRNIKHGNRASST